MFSLKLKYTFTYTVFINKNRRKKTDYVEFDELFKNLFNTFITIYFV